MELFKGTTREGAINGIKELGKILIERADDIVGDIKDTIEYTITITIDLDFNPTIKVTKSLKPVSVIYALLSPTNDPEELKNSLGEAWKREV